MILVTGFEPFGAHSVNPSEGLAKAVDGRRFGACAARGAVLPVHHADAARRLDALLDETEPVAVVHLGLAAGRARVRSEEHTSELQSLAYLVCRLLLEKKKNITSNRTPCDRT